MFDMTNDTPALLRTAVAEDIEVLVEMSISTYRESYAHLPENNNESMELYFQQVFNYHVLLQAFNDKNTDFWVIECEGDIVAYSKLIRMKRIHGLITSPKPMCLDKLYVRKAFQKFGFGKLLLNKSIEVADNEGFDCLWLSVWKVNQKAVTFYQKNGFAIIGSHDFIMANQKDEDWLMLKSLGI
jgi:diamine N-acetyltransferase